MNNLIGQTLLDQYRVDAFVASGGMGAVYRVLDLKRNVPLAMKVLQADLAEDPSVFKRFEREARTLKELAHPNIVPFYGLFRTSDFSFLLEQYVDGPALKEILRQRKALPVEETLIYLKALSAALGYAHAHGVVHCDVKPGNVMIDRGGSIYLTDFGVARHAESTTTTLGSAGTPAYMAPEQCRGEAVTAATDVYTLGILLYEMVTGTRPFQARTTGTKEGSTAGEQIRYAHLHTAPPDPCEINPAIPRPLGNVILKALAKDPQVRYSSTWAMFEAACTAVGTDPYAVPDRVLASRTVNATASGAEAESSSVMPTPQPNAAAAVPLRQRQGQGIMIVAPAVIVLIVVLAIVVKAMKSTATPVPVIVKTTPPQSNVPAGVPSPRLVDSPRAPTATLAIVLTNTPIITPTPRPTPSSVPSATPPPMEFIDHFNELKETMWVASSNGGIKWSVNNDALHAIRNQTNSSDWSDSAAIELKYPVNFAGIGVALEWRSMIHLDAIWGLLYQGIVDAEADRYLVFDCGPQNSLA